MKLVILLSLVCVLINAAPDYLPVTESHTILEDIKAE